MTESILIIALLAVVIIVATVWHHNKHHVTYSDKQLADIVDAIFAERKAGEMTKDEFLHIMKHRVSCTHKDLLYLFGKCRQLGLVNTEGNTVTKC